MTETRGAAGTDDFWAWRTLMYRSLDRLTPDDVEAIAAMVQVEALEAGFAALCEFHYLHHGPDGTPHADPAETAGRIAAAAAETGIGLTLLPVLYRRGGLDDRPVEGAQRRFATTLDGFADLVAAAGRHVAALPGDARLGVAPHSLRAVAMEEIVMAAGLLPDAPVHLHVAEQVAEVEAVLAATGARPVAHLLDRAPVDDRWCLVHATHMVPGETAALAATGAVAGLCPITEANLGDGVFDGARYLAAGGRFGVEVTFP
jgi:formimidoylglutamate deiminase